MPFIPHLCNPCLLPVNTSVLSCTETQSPSSSSIKSLLRRYFSKKRSLIHYKSHPCSILQKDSSARKFQHFKGLNNDRQINLKKKSSSMARATSDYDMTILHDDELNNSGLATIRRRKKCIPFWAQRDQLQLAIINQVYFQEQDPEDIFGNMRVEHLQDIVSSINFHGKASMSMIVSRHVY